MSRAEHFEQVAGSYAGARPPYPAAVYDRLAELGVVRAGARLLEVGPGTGEATAELVARGCTVTAVEPGARLAEQLRERCPEAEVVVGRVETAALPSGAFDAVVGATSLHWVDLPVALPRFRDALREGGLLACWRTAYGHPDDPGQFRREVSRIVADRPGAGAAESPERRDRDVRPTPVELAADGWFAQVGTWSWSWQVDLTPEQVGRLFTTFSDWSADEVADLVTCARRLGPSVRERYTTTLHVLRRT